MTSSLTENVVYYVNSISNFISSPPFPGILLDPMTTLIRLYSLLFRPKDTKLTFEPFSITFDYPTIPSYLQGGKRKFSGKRSSRNDITLLKKSIEIFLSKYNVKNTKLRIFIDGAIRGLKKFHLCYSSQPEDPIVHCVEFYISMLQNSLLSENDAIADADADADCHAASVEEDASTEEVKNVNLLYTSDLDQIFQDLWSTSQVDLVAALLNEIEKQYEQNNTRDIEPLLTSLDSILSSKDKKLEEIHVKPSSDRPISPLAV